MTYGMARKEKCAQSPFWQRYDEVIKNSFDWFGIGDSFEGLSFNVLSVDNEVSWAVNQKDSVIGSWSDKRFDTLNFGSTTKDIPFEFGDGKPPNDEQTPTTCGVKDPRVIVIGSEPGPESRIHHRRREWAKSSQIRCRISEKSAPTTTTTTKAVVAEEGSQQSQNNNSTFTSNVFV